MPRQPRTPSLRGWLYNGDTGFVDEDGYLEIADRTAMSSPGTR